MNVDDYGKTTGNLLFRECSGILQTSKLRHTSHSFSFIQFGGSIHIA
ncbi:hypothetical protein ACU8KH_05296 [Lachancea thermotolerans]